MVRARNTLLIVLVASLAACGSDESPTGPADPGTVIPPTPTNPDPTLTGTFYGNFHNLDMDVAFGGGLSFMLTDSSGVLAGTFGIQGTVDDGQSQVHVAGTGQLEGAVSAGNNATVSIRARSYLCPGHTADYYGAYFRLTGFLYVEGSVTVMDAFCQVLYTWPVMVAMRR